MRPILLLGATAGLMALAFWAPTRRSLTLTVACLIVIPATLVAPNPVSPDLTVTRLVLLTGLAGLLRRTRRSGLTADLRPVRWMLPLVPLVVCGLINGLALAIQPVGTGNGEGQWINLVDQCTCAWLGLIAFRLLGARTVARALTVGLAVSLLIAAIEEVTKGSWGRLLFTGQRSQQNTDAAFPLELRNGRVRVRAGAEFALEFGWTVAMLAPLMVSLLAGSARRSIRWAVVPATAACLAATYWSASRSAIVAVVLLIPVLGLVGHRWRNTRVGLASGLALCAGLLAAPAVLARLSGGTAAGSVAVREQRLPLALGAVAPRPWQGLGWGGLNSIGLFTTDTSYLLAYAQVGAIGAALLGVALLAVVGRTAVGLRTPLRQDRLLAAGCLLSLIAGLAGAAALDLFDVLGSARVFWLIAGLGLGLAETACPARRPVWQPSRIRVAAIGAALAVIAAVAVTATWPTRSVAERQIDVLTGQDEAAPYDPVGQGDLQIATLCGEVSDQVPGATVSCRDLYSGPGIGLIRVEASDPAHLDAALAQLDQLIATEAPGATRQIPVSRVDASLPSAVRTLPVTLPLVISGVLLMVPAGRRRRAAPARATQVAPAEVPAWA